MIFDTINHKVYVNISKRADESLLDKYLDIYNSFSEDKYKKVVFKGLVENKPIYHTNVMLGILIDHAVISLDAIVDSKERDMVIQEFTNPDLNRKPKSIIDISIPEVLDMCGNVLQVLGAEG